MQIAATSNGYIAATHTLDITDYETLSLSLNPASISEQDGQSTATVRRHNTDISQPLTIALSLSDTSEASIPASVTIPAGQAIATFVITAVDDTSLDGVQLVTVTASHAAYVSATESLSVTDAETLTLELASSSISEKDGVTTATITRSNTDVGFDLVVTILGSDDSESSLPTSVTIPAGENVRNLHRCRYR